MSPASPTSTLLAADLVSIPLQLSAIGGGASAEMLRLVNETRVFRPDLRARFILNAAPRAR